MLDFYAVEDLEGWPDDIPTTHRWLGAMDLREFQSCGALVQSCLRGCGVQASYFADWIVPREEVGALLRCLREAADPDAGLGTLISIVARAEGSILLAVCD